MYPIYRISLGLFFGLTVSFIVTGYQAVLPIFIDSGVYSDLCEGNVTGCTDQLNFLNLMYTISMTALNMMTLPVGLLIGKTGPMLMSMCGCVLISIGSILIAVSSSKFPLWFAGYVIMSAGGPCVAFPMFTLPALFPKKQGLLFSLIVAMFDASAIIMYVFQILYNYADLSIMVLFLSYLIFPIGLFIAAPFLFDRTIPFLNKKQEEKDENETKSEALYDGSSLKKVFKSLPVYLLIFWSASYVTTKYFYITNLNSIVLWISGDSDEASIATQVFSIILPLAGIFTPITAFLLDKTQISVSIIILGILSMITGILSVLPSYYLQYLTILCVVFSRFFFFSTAPLLLSKIYGPDGPGIYGVINFIAACFNTSNFLWSYLCVENNQNFYIFNLLLSTLCLISSILVSLFWYKKNQSKKSNYNIIQEL